MHNTAVTPHTYLSTFEITLFIALTKRKNTFLGLIVVFLKLYFWQGL
ncbi:MAG: hypothetical protein LRY27_02290 [Chitinophagales bacterium]|nr:hypothetical protein [Chitinophagales bacterium]